MITSTADERIKEVRPTDDELVVAFVDGRTLSIPLVWYPRLLHASPEQRRDWHLIGDGEGVHWPQIDEDLSAAGMLRGISAPAVRPRPDNARKQVDIDRSTEIEDRFAAYEVYDQNGEKIGTVDDLFVDENDNPEYIGVKMGFLGTSSTLIPWELATVNESASRIEVATDKETAKNGPTFDDDMEITPVYENKVHSYYGLQREEHTEEVVMEKRPVAKEEVRIRKDVVGDTEIVGGREEVGEEVEVDDETTRRTS